MEFAGLAVKGSFYPMWMGFVYVDMLTFLEAFAFGAVDGSSRKHPPPSHESSVVLTELPASKVF